MSASPASPLRVARLAAGWSQRKLACRARVALRTVQDVEAGIHQPYMRTRRRLLGALGIPLAEHRHLFGPRAKTRPAAEPRA